jgi:tetratricopeptide (TPR) repeat protein
MPVLRLSQFAEAQDTFRVELSLDGSASVRTPSFKIDLTPQDSEDLRWYLEDYLAFPLDPAPEKAARIEERMKEIGATLFRNVFQSNEAMRRAWARLMPDLNDTRIEIVAEVQHATAIPWELMRDPETDKVLSVHARAFVRAASNQAEPPTHIPSPSPSKGEGSKIRILLVICRPREGDDVPFRSVASRIVKSLTDEAREFVQLDVLRPPTFEQLSKVLRSAKVRGEPYHIVHFDGHGVYQEVKQSSDWLKGLSPLILGATGKHGFLLFENPLDKDNIQPIEGAALGKLLTDNDVPVLVLNACRSAFADPPTQPLDASQAGDIGEQVHTFGSLAQVVMNAGVAGVVAMRYTLYVETAKEFIANLYAALAQGQSLGEAVTFGRNQLAMNPLREIAYKPIALQDWCVPIVYEAAPIELFPKSGDHAGSPLRITLDSNLKPETSNLELDLPPRPDVGFFGRDETLLALDRAFDTQQIVLLHAFAGSGKTTTAAEFARWYALTGGLALSGVEGAAILFTSFERRKTLTDALNETIGRAFNDALEHAGVHWLALSDEKRRVVARQVLQQIPVLWIWDNVEPIAGFPAGTPSAWSAAEQQELVAFLRDARETKAKFLLTSRRDERGWLGDLPRRIPVPPMPMQERVQLARALAEKFGHRITDVDDWTPLLQFTQGNPLTITVVVGAALRQGIKSRLEIGDFVERLRKGEAAFEDEASEGRSKSLGASLSYGFASAFTETERKQLALIHFFQGFVDARVLLLMGNPKADYALPELRDLTPQGSIALLDRAAEIGLLTAHGNGYYAIHPALPWYFKALFDQYYSGQWVVNSGQKNPDHYPLTTAHSAQRAFVEAMGSLGDYYHHEYNQGNRDVIGVLGAEEANLLHARQIALRLARSAAQGKLSTNGWWGCVIKTMQGLRQLYAHTGRRAEWAALVNEIVPDFIDPATDGPLEGREEQWKFVTEYRVQLAIEARQWQEAERLQRVRVEGNRKRAAPALAVPANLLDHHQRNNIESLAASLDELGRIQRFLKQPECVATYKESLSLSESIGDQRGVAIASFNLGHAYMGIPVLRDLAQAERWYRRSLEQRDERDNLGRAYCLDQLGAVSFESFKEARAVGESNTVVLSFLNAALKFYHQGLDLLPPNAVNDLAVAHSQLGLIYADGAGDLDRALPHFREAIRYTEATGNLYQAGQLRHNVAVALAQAGRLADALEYALAALRNFETLGDRAAEMIEQTRRLVGWIEGKMRGG